MVATERQGVTPVGKPGRAWLELRGSILIYRRESWVTSASLFMPIEWVSVSTYHRRDYRQLWNGIIGLMAAALFTLPLSLLLFFMGPYEPGDLWIATGLGALLCIAAGSGIWSLLRFLPRRPVTVLKVANAAYPLEIAFWRHPGERPGLDALVARLEHQPGQADERMPYPVRMNHLWRRPRPFRIALVRGLTIAFALYVALLVMELLRLAGLDLALPGVLYALLAVPPLAHLAHAALRRDGIRREPASFREALRAYQRGELGEAQALLASLLEQDPGHALGRLLMVQACAEAAEFDAAMAHCEALAREEPLLATRLQASLWGLKRLHDRMGP